MKNLLGVGAALGVVWGVMLLAACAGEGAERRVGPESSVPAAAFSFVYGGTASRELLSAWKREEARREVDAERAERTRTWTDPRTGLVVRCVTTVYRDFPAVEWVVYFKNTGSADTPMLEDVQALDDVLGEAEAGGAFKVHYAEGSHEKITDFRPMEKTLGAGGVLRLGSFGGRPSDGVLPFFDVEGPGGKGVVVGVGWTGQWAATLGREGGGGVRVRAGMERTHLRLRAGEEIRTPAVLLMHWNGGDWVRGQNLWRQLLLRHYTPRPGGQDVVPPGAGSPHGVVAFEQTSEENQRRMIGNIAAHKVPVDTWWVDAGWYTCLRTPRNWAAGVGNPEPDPERYPRGMTPVAEAAHAAGMKFLLWFEPERVMRDTWVFKNHREWLLEPGKDTPPELQYQVHDGFYLLDLGNAEALAWVKGKVSGMIGSAGIDGYRNDCNLYPVYFWRNGEAADRQGMREIKYVMGLYDYFDTLQREHPGLLMDNCASGGRRIDFEMLRRALVLTRSDYLWDPIGQQCHTYGLAQWIPITGIGSDSPDVYKCRSGLGSHFVLAAKYNSQDPAEWEAIRRTMQEYQSVKHLYIGDFYPLGAYSTASDAWMAWQFHRGERGEGLVQAFRRQDCAETTMTFRLCGLEAAAEYVVADRDDAKARVIIGRELMERGITITLLNKPSAALITYRKIER